MDAYRPRFYQAAERGKKTLVSGPDLTNRGTPPSAELDQGKLDAVRVAVEQKLRRSYHQSEDFAADVAEEMVDEAYAEYAELPPAKRAAIVNLVGWLAVVAIRRSIDKARGEGREVYGEGAEIAIENAVDGAPSTEALAFRGIEAEEIHDAVSKLSGPQRRAIALQFWQELSTRDAASLIGTSAMTVSRRRRDAMAALRRLFGVEEGTEADRQLAIEAGFAAHLILIVGGSSTRAAVLSAVGEPIGASFDLIRRGAAWPVARVRDLAYRFVGSGSGETLTTGGATAVTPVRGAVGLCAGAVAVVCGAGAIGVGPAAPLLDPGPRSDATERPPARVSHPPAPTVRQPVPMPVHRGATIKNPETTAEAAGGNQRKPSERPRTTRSKLRIDRHGRQYNPESERAANDSLGIESEAPEPAPEPEVIPESVPPEPTEPSVGTPGGGADSASAAANNQFAP